MKLRHLLGRCLLFCVGGVALMLMGCLFVVLVMCLQQGFGIQQFKFLPSPGTVLFDLVQVVGLLLGIGMFGGIALSCWGLAVANIDELGPPIRDYRGGGK